VEDATTLPELFKAGRGGYIFVFEDVRGRYRSGNVHDAAAGPRAGDTISRRHRHQDTIDWLLKNVSGNNSRVGMLRFRTTAGPP
jgi:predicted acyl esterase